MKNKVFYAILAVGFIVAIMAFLSLVFGDVLAATYDVIGIRIATLIVAFASFISSTTFSLLVYVHNRTVSRVNDDANRRAELFRELQFASSNYSIIEFMDRMLIYNESERYIDRFIKRGIMSYHMLESQIDEKDVLENPQNYNFISMRIPFQVIEGKMVSQISFTKLSFVRDFNKYTFVTPKSETDSRVFILYNELTKRNNVIVNLIYSKDSSFMSNDIINHFNKIKIRINITSLLGVRVKGISELYFTSPEKIEGNESKSYKITSSNFTLTEMPTFVETEN